MEIKQSKDVCIDRLSSTQGSELDIMANINSNQQMNAVMLGFVGAALNSKYCVGRTEMLLRLTVSWKGRGRDDLASIGRVPDIQGWTSSTNNNNGDILP